MTWSNGRIPFVFGEVVALTPRTAGNIATAFDKPVTRSERPILPAFRRSAQTSRYLSVMPIAPVTMHADIGPFYPRPKRSDAVRMSLATHIFTPAVCYVLRGRADKSR